MACGNAPTPPDYTSAANAQADASRNVINAQTQANRPNINTPLGSMSWTQTKVPGGQQANPERLKLEQQLAQLGGGAMTAGLRQQLQEQINAMPATVDGPSNTAWQMNVQLTPEQEAALKSQQQIQSGRSDVARQLLTGAGQDVSKGIDWASLGAVQTGDAARQQAIDSAYKQSESRLTPMWSQREGSQRAQLANQGLSAGDEAYDTAVANMGRERNDAYSSALANAIGQGTAAGAATFGQNLQARQQQLGEANQQQYGRLNALNALLAGQQVNMPNFPGFNQAGAAQAPQYLNAANMGYQGALNQYGANQAQLQGMLSGGMGLLGLAFGG